MDPSKWKLGDADMALLAMVVEYGWLDGDKRIDITALTTARVEIATVSCVSFSLYTHSFRAGVSISRW